MTFRVVEVREDASSFKELEVEEVEEAEEAYVEPRTESGGERKIGDAQIGASTRLITN